MLSADSVGKYYFRPDEEEDNFAEIDDEDYEEYGVEDDEEIEDYQTADYDSDVEDVYYDDAFDDQEELV